MSGNLRCMASSSASRGGTDFASSEEPEREDLSGCIRKADKLLHSIEGILDLMRPGNIDVITQVINAGITSRDILKGVTWLIFEKAVSETTFCPLYAELCWILSPQLPSFGSDEPDGKRISFRKSLLNLCQETFEVNYGLRYEIKQMAAKESQRRGLERAAKLRAMGNIRLIGELYKQYMIPEKIVHHCIQELLSVEKKVAPTEEGLELVCQLLNIVGEELDQNPRSRVHTDSYFAMMKKLSSDHNLPSRVRLMVQDVLNLRASNWIPENEEVEAENMYFHRPMSSGIQSVATRFETTNAAFQKASTDLADGDGTDFAFSGRPESEDLSVCINEADKVLHSIEGILNQMRPENIDVLSQIISAAITSRDILKGVTWLIFEKAVSETTFCPMYAELCCILNRELPSFPSDETVIKRISFRWILLNLCQETLKGNYGLGDEIKQMTAKESQRLGMERTAKLRAMGNIRLIGELFKQYMIPEKIVHHCIRELLSVDKKVAATEEALELVCEVLNIVGKKQEQTPRSRVLTDSYFTVMKRLSSDQNLPSRVRLMVRDVLHLRARNWIPENEEVAAETLDTSVLRLMSFIIHLAEGSKQPTHPFKNLLRMLVFAFVVLAFSVKFLL